MSLIARHRNESDDFSLTNLDFMYAPGGHAPMVDFHAPVAVTFAKFRLGYDGSTLADENHAFAGAHVTTVPKYGEIGMLEVGYPKIPGKKTRLQYFVDVALKDAG